MGKSTAKRLRYLRAVSARKLVVMSFYADPSFFVLLSVAVVGAAVLGLLEKSLKWYGLVASLFFVALLFMNDAAQFACFVLFLASSAAGCALIMRTPKSKWSFRIALAFTLYPLVVCKVSGAFDASLLGFAGISYLTFKATQVVIEVHDGIIERMSPSDWLCFIVFFPVFTSGPIDRSRRFVADLHATLSRDEYAGLLARGIVLIAAGMVYKMVIAAYIFRLYDPHGWGNAGLGVELWQQVIIAYQYGLYLFFDFAGYSLMAMGASYCFGIRTPRNFRAPFLAVDIKDFWNRWHITLSFWLRDFVFMRFSRFALKHKLFKKRLRVAQCGFMVNMLLMGAWHGLSADYLLYGLFHGVLLAATEAFQKTKFYKAHKKELWFRGVSWFVTMQAVFFGFALFSGQITRLACGA